MFVIFYQSLLFSVYNPTGQVDKKKINCIFICGQQQSATDR